MTKYDEVPTHLIKWVTEHQIVLDRLLRDKSPEYLETRIKFQEEYEKLLKEIPE
jgi:hypothetical protein